MLTLESWILCVLFCSEANPESWPLLGFVFGGGGAAAVASFLAKGRRNGALSQESGKVGGSTGAFGIFGGAAGLDACK